MTNTQAIRILNLSLKDLDSIQLIKAGITRSEPIEGEYNYRKNRGDGGKLLCAHCTELFLICEEKKLHAAEGIYLFEKGTLGLCNSCGDWAVDDYTPFLGKLKNYLPATIIREANGDLSEFGF